MKCINCYREIDNGLKFCPKCGVMQPADRAAYELEHPELAEALPEDEIIEKVNLLAELPRTAMARDEFTQLIASDPHCDSIMNIADDGVATYGLAEPTAVEAWYAKCYELIGDKQGFYPYFVKLLTQQPEKARNLLHSQAADDLNLVLPLQEMNSTQPEPQLTEDGEIIPPLPPALPSQPPVIGVVYGPPTPDEYYPVDNASPSNEVKTLTSSTSANDLQPIEGQTMVECPICHQPIAYGMRQCPYCKQLLDWSYSSQDTQQEVGEKPKRGTLWTVLAILLALLIGGAGYYIYTSVKDKTHISKNDDDTNEPTGNPRKDAKQCANELLDLLENAYIETPDDYDELENDYKDIIEKYDDYYKDLGDDEMNEYQRAVTEFTENNPDINDRYEKAIRRIERQRSKID